MRPRSNRSRDPFGFLRRVFQFRSARPAQDAEVDAEIEYHLERTEDELLRGGVPGTRARDEAIRRFGDLDEHRRRLRALSRRRGRKDRLIMLGESLAGVVRDAARALRSSPATTATIVVTLALGIGANAAMFGIIDRLLLQPPAHVVDHDRVVRLYVQKQLFGQPTTTAWITYPDFRDLDAVEGFTATAAFFSSEMTVGEGRDALRARSQQVNPEMFPLLGVAPLHGRFFTAEKDVVGAAEVVVLGHDFWESRYGADPQVLGRRIRIAGVDHEIVGVAPAGFTGVSLGRVDLWLPLRSAAGGSTGWEESRGWYWLQAIARLAPGATPEAAAAEATVLHRAAREGDERYDPEATVIADSLITARGGQRSDDSVVARWLAGVAAIVLLIACANVANILVANGLRRRREIGTRLALGISCRRLTAQLLTEGVFLALLGGIAGLAVAWFGAAGIRGVLLPQVHWADAPINTRVLAFTFAAAVLTGLAAGVLPAFHAARQDLVDLIGSGIRGPRDRSRMRVAILVLQTALSVVLLVGAGLFVKSLARVRAIDLGFDPAGVVTVSPEIDDSAVEIAEMRPVMLDVAEQLRGLPEIRGVTASVSAPFRSSYSTRLVVPDVPELPRFEGGGPYRVAVTPDYFATMGVRVLRGRGLTATDTRASERVVVVEETMANGIWPGQDPIGRCIKIGGDEEPCSTVVGVAEKSARQSLLPREGAQYYVSILQSEDTPRHLFVRLASDVAVPSVAAMIRDRFLARSSAIRYVGVEPLLAWIDPHARSWRIGATLFSIFGGLALTIAAVGLYGALAFSVAQRRHEIGVRSALGARAARLVGMVTTQALAWILASLVAGVGVALFVGRWLEPLLYEVHPADLGVIASATTVLLLVALAAASIPAARAARVDPVEALRDD